MSFLYNSFYFFLFLHHNFSFYKLLKLTSLQSCLHHNIFLITDTYKINYTYYSFRWSCDIDIHLFLYGLHDTTLYYYWHHACSCTLYRMYFKKIFPEITVFVVVKINSSVSVSVSCVPLIYLLLFFQLSSIESEGLILVDSDSVHLCPGPVSLSVA